MVGDYGLEVAHTAIAQFKSVTIKDFMKWVRLRKVLIDEWKKAFSNFRFNIFTVWWIEPCYISLTVSTVCRRCIRNCFFVRQFVFVTTFA